MRRATDRCPTRCNHAFRDRYVGSLLDLSAVTLVATATDPTDIPMPLLERLKLVRLEEYAAEESCASRPNICSRASAGVTVWRRPTCRCPATRCGVWSAATRGSRACGLLTAAPARFAARHAGSRGPAGPSVDCCPIPTDRLDLAASSSRTRVWIHTNAGTSASIRVFFVCQHSVCHFTLLPCHAQPLVNIAFRNLEVLTLEANGWRA